MGSCSLFCGADFEVGFRYFCLCPIRPTKPQHGTSSFSRDTDATQPINFAHSGSQAEVQTDYLCRYVSLSTLSNPTALLWVTRASIIAAGSV